ncbi:MAG: hypothetical protein MUC50_20020 [Myxococcota bacterium]|jgi:hypothetical protein|nr:hypothetical protein [Myxococcota bacterium]
MARRTASPKSRTREIIEDIFAHPPVNEAELARRLQSVDATMARRIIIDRLLQRELPDRDGPLFVAVLGQVGLGRQKGRLAAVALDDERTPRERLWASMALTSQDPTAMEMLAERMGPSGLGALAEASLFEMLALQGRDQISESVAMALAALLEDRDAAEILARLESCRRSIGASCTDAYAASLSDPELLHIRPQLLEFFVEESSESGVALLERLRDETGEPAQRRAFQSALLKLRSRRIDPLREHSPGIGHAFVSNCDGQGGFVLLAVFDNLDGTFTVADLCIRAGGDVRDGFVYPRRPAGEVDSFVERAKQQLGCLFARVPLSFASTLVQEALQRTKGLGLEVPEDARTAVALFVDIEASSLPEPLPSSLNKKLSVGSVRKLLSRPEYEDTWFFDLGDLGDVEPPPRDGRAAMAAWIEAAAAKLDAPTIRRRLRAMALHMARWHGWNGEPELKRMCEALAGDVEEGFESSVLLRVMIERSAVEVDTAPLECETHFGDPDERQHLKARFFQSATTPSGRELAVLDFTEACTAALQRAFELLPGENRPRDDAREQSAFDIATLFVRYLLDEPTPGPDEAMQELSRALGKSTRLTATQRHKVLLQVVPALYAFVEDICSHCLVDCLSRPQADASEVFFASDHPLVFDRSTFE